MQSDSPFWVVLGKKSRIDLDHLSQLDDEMDLPTESDGRAVKPAESGCDTYRLNSPCPADAFLLLRRGLSKGLGGETVQITYIYGILTIRKKTDTSYYPFGPTESAVLHNK